MTEAEAKKICDVVRQTAYDLHVYLGVGYLEKVYENGLVHRLQKAGMNVRSQVPQLSEGHEQGAWLDYQFWIGKISISKSRQEAMTFVFFAFFAAKRKE